MAEAARDAWREALVRARRQPTHRADVQFARAPSAQGAIRHAVCVRDALGQRAGCPVLHFAVTEPNKGRRGNHLHVLLWVPEGLVGAIVERQWECRSSRVRLRTLWTRADEATAADRPDSHVPVADAVGYALKYMHHLETEWDASPRLLRRIGAPCAD